MEKLLVIGVGSIGKRHIDNFSNYFEKIDIVDVNPERIVQVCDQFKINKSYEDYVTALEENIYDAVAVTTPPHLHLPISKLAAEKGANLFIEKPLGMSLVGWDEVDAICKKNNLVGFVAYCHRFIPYSERLKELVSGGVIGRVIHANVRWGSYLPDWHPWEDYRSFYMAKKEQGGGALLDESHGIDLVRYVLGDVKEVFAIVDNLSDLELTSDDTAFLTLRMESNELVHINFDLSSRTPRVNFELIGTEGNIIWDRVEHKIKIYTTIEEQWSEEIFTRDDLMSMYPNQAKHFVNCCTGKEKPMISIKDSIKTQKVIDAAFLSSKELKLIKLS